MVLGFTIDRTGTTYLADLCPECGVPLVDVDAAAPASGDLDALTAELAAVVAQLRAFHHWLTQGRVEG